MKRLFIEITDAYPLLRDGDAGGALLRLSRFDWREYEKSLAEWVATIESGLGTAQAVSLIGISKCASLAIELGHTLSEKHPAIQVSVLAVGPLTNVVMNRYFRKEVSPWLAARFSEPGAWDKFSAHADLLKKLPLRADNLDILVLFSWSEDWTYDLEQSERLRVLPYVRFVKIPPEEFLTVFPAAKKADFHTMCLKAYQALYPEAYRRFLTGEKPRKILLVANRPVRGDDRDVSAAVDSCDLVVRVSRMPEMQTGKIGSRIDWVFLEPNDVYLHYVARDPSIEERIARAQRVFIREGNWAERYEKTGLPFTAVPIPPDDRHFTTSALALYTLLNEFPDEVIHIAGMDVGKDRREHVCVGPHRVSGECGLIERMLDCGRVQFLLPEDHERWIAEKQTIQEILLTGDGGFLERRRLEVSDGSLEKIEMLETWEFLDPTATVEAAKECWRALKPGGVLRIVAPDLCFLSRLMNPVSCDAHDEHSKEAEFVREYLDRWLPDAPIYAPSLVVNHFMTSRGFAFVWDRGLLLEVLAESGFEEFYSESDHDHLENMVIMAVK